MAKRLFKTDFEVNASKKMLFPYINTASGLAQWMADDVTVNEDKVFSFVWDNEDHKAKIISQRSNHYVKFEFLPESDDDHQDPSYLELRLEVNELTQTVFLLVTDYSDMEDQQESQDLWENLVGNLKETVGG